MNSKSSTAPLKGTESASRPPFKADVVGSLLRPPAIHEARRRRERGDISAEELRAVEEQCVAQAVAMQRDVGLYVCTDGEFHRRHWFLDFLERIEGVEVHGGLPTKFRNEQGDVEFAPPRFEVHAKLRRSRPLALDDFRSLKPVAGRNGLMPKQAIPSPMCIHFRGGRAAIDAAVYPDVEAFFEDLAQVYREEIADLYAAGCRYLQIDDTNLPFLCDPGLRDNVRRMGEDPDTLPALYVRMMNDALRDKPADLVVGVHMCRGNHASSWVAEGGYDPIAERVFSDMDVDAFFLEYDSPRAGGFEPLRFLGKNKVAVLGLVTTKKPQLESKDALKRRLDEAARHVPLDRLALSPQCGFASTLAGNAVTPDDQRRKLALVVEIAREVWGA
ncbi:MAG TPA: 5-methyltetrahydropteroyltriglutamate--homocysteine S-methyltransferase [Xanthobacteraceae bacterium]|nr:5-methyltetrahydropteroyltriglutamate--homocysteine S-methyltransferase [Xanthobacteraceae bacterium]